MARRVGAGVGYHGQRIARRRPQPIGQILAENGDFSVARLHLDLGGVGQGKDAVCRFYGDGERNEIVYLETPLRRQRRLGRQLSLVLGAAA